MYDPLRHQGERPANDNPIEDTIAIWTPRAGGAIGREDARRIAANAVGFFGVLIDWSRRNLPTPANDDASPGEAGE